MLNVGGRPPRRYAAAMDRTPGAGGAGDTLDALRRLRERADDDHLNPGAEKVGGRHQVDLPELGLRISVTRSRYPNRDDGIDQYAVTLTRSRLDAPPADSDVRTVLEGAFGAAADEAVERTGGGPLVRMFRVPAG